MILKTIAYIILILAIILFISAIINQIVRSTSRKKLEAKQHQLVTVEGVEISVEILGEQKDVIVFLSGYGSPSPILEFRPIAERLQNYFTVITVEYPGYGFSSSADSKRSIANITKELHACLEKLGYHEYYLAAHSISGIYSLYYAHRYPENVKGFIGIDPSVPRQNEAMDITWLELLTTRIMHLFQILGISRWKALCSKTYGAPVIKNYFWDKEDQILWMRFANDKAYNKTVMQELKLVDENIDQVHDLVFDKTLPVLCFVSSKNCEMMKEWKELHERIITNTTHSELIVLEGSHYLHYAYPEEIADKIIEWTHTEKAPA